MNKLVILAGILLFALVTAVLYAWGLHKSMTQQEDLNRLLMSKCADKVLHRLKEKGSLTRKEIEEVITGVKAGEFYSRKRVAVQNPGQFAGTLIDYMTGQQLIESENGAYRRK